MNAIAPKHRPRGRMDNGAPNPIDVHVGHRIAIRRSLLGFSQNELGNRIGLTFQQVQKYERGANRVGASRLYDLSCALDVPVNYFFDDMPDSAIRFRPANVARNGGGEGYQPEPPPSYLALNLSKRIQAMPRQAQEALKRVLDALDAMQPVTEPPPA